MRLFICEKHLQAKALAQYLSRHGGDALRTPAKTYFQVGNDLIVWAQGHLFVDPMPQDIDPAYVDWRAPLPIIPDSLIRIRPTNPTLLAQLEAIEELIKRATTIVHACDFDREGQRIGDDILEHFGITANVRRLPLVGYDDRSIERAFEAMAPNEEQANLAIAARVRSYMDWIHGINYTRKITNKASDRGYGQRIKIPCGRVVSPILGLIAKREEQIANHIPVTFYAVGVLYTNRLAKAPFELRLPEHTPGLDDKNRLVDRTVANALKNEIDAVPAKISKVEDTEEKTRAELPFSMASLQSEMNKKHRMTLKQTASALQRLYSEFYLVSYPRSNCRYYEEHRHADGAATLHMIGKNIPAFRDLCKNASPSYKSPAFDDSEVKAHSALAPLLTEYPIDQLPEMEKWVYEAICRRYIQQFYEEAKYAVTTYTATSGRLTLTARRRALAVEGWLVATEDGAPKEKPEGYDFAVGDVLTREASNVFATTTRPPRSFTEDSLIRALNAIEKHVDDEDLKHMLGSNAQLGTEATQADNVEKLIACRLIERKDNYLRPTTLGRNVVAVLPDELRGVGMTAASERDLTEIAFGRMDPAVFVQRHRMKVMELCAALDKAVFAELPKGADGFGSAKRENTVREAEMKARGNDAA